MISVQDLVKRVERDSDQTGERTRIFPTNGEPKLSTGRAAHAPSQGSHAAPPRDPVTEVIPKITDPVVDPAEETRALPTRLQASRQRRYGRFWLAAKVATAASAAATLVLTGVGWNYLRATDDGFKQVAALDENSADVVDPVGQTGDETYLIVGVDSRAGANSKIGAGTTQDADGVRSDTVMLVNIPADRQRVVAVSFPRDLDVSRPVCQGWDNGKATYTDETYPAADNDKLNATYALGGPKCLVKVIQKMSGLNIGHFVGIDFVGFESMVNTLGGVEVCNKIPLVDGELGTVLAKTGKQTISGKTALNYVRARHVAAETSSDYDRIKRQQRFLSSLLRAGLSSKVLLDPGKLNNFIGAFTHNSFFQNVTTKDMLTLGRSMQKMDAGAVTFLTVPTAGTTTWGNEIPRLSDIKALFTAIINDKPLPGEKAHAATPPTPTTAATPPPPKQQIAVDAGTATLEVLNGTGRSGVGSTVATKLGRYGFTVSNTDTYSGGTAGTTTVRYAPGHEAEAATIATAIPDAALQEAKDITGEIEVVLGSDFTGTVKSPTPPGKPITKQLTVSTLTSTPTATTLPSDLEHVNAADKSCS